MRVLSRALILLVLTLVACWPQWSVPDWHGTEARRVQIALEMATSGDWLVPTIGGQATWAKPPLHYWLLGGLAKVFGADPWVMRAPAVLGLFGAALLAMELLRRWFGTAAGRWGALGIVLSPVVLFVWPTAEIDPLFACLTAASLWCLATGVARERRSLVLWSGVLGGLALLDKRLPYFLFAAGAYLVWWRRRGGRFAVAHFLPLLAVPLLYCVALWSLRADLATVLTVVENETLGRLLGAGWGHLTTTPAFWLRAVAVQLPFVLWCFWEWRGARDARMDAADLTLRMCSGAAVLAVVVLTVFPGRPTRYLLPNVLLFTFAVVPAVAHFAGQQRPIGAFSQRWLRRIGIVGALALMTIPLLDTRVPLAAVGLALVAALGPFCVRTPRHVVVFCLVLPLVAAWTVGLGRAMAWPDSAAARRHVGQLLQRELAAAGALAEFATIGHVEGPLLLGAGLLPMGDEAGAATPTARWLLHERAEAPRWSSLAPNYVERFRICVPGQVFAVRERVAGTGR